MGPRNLYRDSYGSGKGKIHWPTLLGMAFKAFHNTPHLSIQHWLFPRSLNDLLAFIHAVPNVQHAVPSHSAPTKLLSSSPRAGSEVPAP